MMTVTQAIWKVIGPTFRIIINNTISNGSGMKTNTKIYKFKSNKLVY